MFLSREEQHDEVELKCFTRGVLTESLVNSIKALVLKDNKMVIAKLFAFLIECAEKRNEKRNVEDDAITQNKIFEIVISHDRNG